MRKVHNISLLFCLAGFATTACNVDYSNRGRPDGGTIPDADTTDSNVEITGRAETSIQSGSISGEAHFAASADGVTGTVELTLAPENPEERGVRIMTGSSCDDGSEGTVWELGDLGNMTIEEVAPHTGGGEMTVDRSDWTIGTGADTDIDGRVIVIYSEAGASGTIASCGVIETAPL